MAALRALAEDVKARNSVGKLNKFAMDDSAIADAKAGKVELARLDLLQKATSKLEGVCGFLREAVACFGEGVAASDDALALRAEVIAALTASEIDTAAVADLTAAIRIAPRQPELLRLRARAHVLNQDYEAALNDVARANEMAPAAVPLDQLRQHLANLVARQSADSNDM